MKIFGFNITRSTRSTPPPVTRSFDPAAWLTGRDLPTGPCLSNAYEQVVWVYRAINVIAEQIANIPFLFSRGERGRENLITSGPLLDFYAQPHPHINQFQYWELRIFYLMLRGECIRIPIYSDNPDLDPNRDLNPNPNRNLNRPSFPIRFGASRFDAPRSDAPHS